MDIVKRHGLKLSVSALLGFLTLVPIIIIGFLLLALVAPPDEVLNSEGIASFIEDNSFSLTLGFIFMIIIYSVIASYLAGGLIGSVNDVVFRNQSSTVSFVQHGFKNLWMTLKMILLLFLLFVVAIIMIGILMRFISEFNYALATLLLLLLCIFLIPLSPAINHILIIYYEQKIGAFRSIKAGLETFRKAYRQNYLSAIIASFSALSVYLMAITAMVVLASVVFLLNLAITNPDTIALDEWREENELLQFMIFFLYLLIIPIIQIVSQLIITIRFKNKIAPIVFPNGLPKQEPFTQQHLYPQQPFHNQHPYPQQQSNQTQANNHPYPQQQQQPNQPDNPFNWG
ncbi:hypothetical protein [Thermoactinomyces sp. DSM 45892]|uniref:hypothetical protein n=1 Tax=Thermoactinomyces sp. DSM 45892 TaxID=1882753 RepID=UPI00089B818B|nr:hypothetical protein [Thermoactinomyces sp. DSM 45892]SDZ16960.1 hypothetical protein SAMN05444416_11533 [Thermoactinomyces sp. DSM 45892]